MVRLWSDIQIIPNKALRLWLIVLLCLFQGPAATAATDWLGLCHQALARVAGKLSSTNLSGRALRTDHYSLATQIMSRAEKRLSPSEFDHFQHWYYDHFFSDLEETLVDNSLSSHRRSLPTTRYNRYGQTPFSWYRSAREYLFSKNIEDVDFETMQSVQRIMLTGKKESKMTLGDYLTFWRRSEFTPPSWIGKPRNRPVYYMGIGQELRLGRDLFRISDGSAVPQPKTLEEVAKNNDKLQVNEEGGLVKWEYTPLGHWERYRKYLPEDLILDIESLVAEKGKAFLDQKSSVTKKLRRRFYTALTNRIQESVKEIMSSKTEAEVIEKVGSFYYDMMSWHLFMNGNGRSVRLLSERMLESFNLPPPIWSFMGEDVVLKKSDFIKLMKDGVLLSKHFHQELDAVTRVGVEYDAIHSPILAGRVDRLAAFEHEVDPQRFMKWIHYTNQRPTLLERLRGKKGPTSIHDLAKRFEAWEQGWNYKGEGHKGVRMGTPLQHHLFGRLSTSEEHYQRKRSQDYSEESVIVGRPLNHTLEDKDLLSYFTTGLDVSSRRYREHLQSFNESLVNGGTLSEGGLKNRGGIASIPGTRSYATWDLARDELRGIELTQEEKRKIRSTLAVYAKKREFGVVDFRFGSENGAVKRDPKRPTIYHAAGIEGEAIDKLVVEDIDPFTLSQTPALTRWAQASVPGIGAPLRSYEVTGRREALRLGHNQFLIHRFDAKGALLSTSHYQWNGSEMVEMIPPQAKASSLD